VSELAALDEFLKHEERDFERRVGAAKGASARLKEVKTEVISLEQAVELHDQAILLLSQFADTRQAEVQAKVEGLVTYGLRIIFGEGMSFHILQDTKNKLAAANFVVRSKAGNDVVETPIMDARGGGVAAVAGFLLRLIILLLTSKARRLLVLDETFAQLSSEYEEPLADFLRELVDRTGTQVIMVTHSSAYDVVADKVYRFTQINGVTKVVPV
jgi:DNA repair exonuclease SbcCD ATPase subunit